MKRKFLSSYELISCTAIAASIGDHDRQDAILVLSLDSSDADDCVLFGYSLDDVDEATWEDICCYDSSAFSFAQEDLDSVLIDGLPISKYIGGAL